MKQAKTMMMNAIQKELDGRLHDSECRNCHLAIAHTDNEEAALEFKKEVEERFPNADVYMAPLSFKHRVPYRAGQPCCDGNEQDGRGT